MSILEYLKVRPLGFWNALRLYLDFAAALETRLFRVRSRLVGRYFPGAFIVGDSKLRVTLDGIVFQVRPRSYDIIIASGQDEPLIGRIFAPKKDQVVVDIGAHIGRYSLLALKAGARVLSIEPEAENFELLSRNVAENRFKGVSLFNLAVSDEETRGELYVAANRAVSTLIPSRTSLNTPRPSVKTQSVKCRRLDTLIAESGVSRIDWLKIDVEGNEMKVLSGGSRALEMAENLIVEVSEENKATCTAILRSHDFVLRVVQSSPGIETWYLQRGAHQASPKWSSPTPG